VDMMSHHRCYPVDRSSGSISGYDVALCLSSNVCLCAGIARSVRSSISVLYVCYVVICRYAVSWLVSCSHCQILIVSFVFGSDPG